MIVSGVQVPKNTGTKKRRGNLRAKAIKSEVEHQCMEINLGSGIGSLAKVLENLLGLDHKHIASVFTESLDVKDMRGLLALELPCWTVGCEDSYIVLAWRGEDEREEKDGRKGGPGFE